MDLDKIPKIIIKLLALPLRIAVPAFEWIGIFPNFTRAFRASGAFGKGSREYDAGNYELAFRILKPVADIEPSSIPEESVVCYAQYLVGIMYYHGQGVQENEVAGEQYFSKAAALGNPEAIEYLQQIGEDKQ